MQKEEVEALSSKQILWSWELEAPEEPITITLNEYRIGSKGNIVTLIAPPGYGKTSIVEAMGASAIASEEIDTLGLHVSCKNLLIIDTELSLSDFRRAGRRIARRAKILEPNPIALRFESWKIISSISTRKSLLIETLKRTDCDVILVDGISDFVNSVNDEAEANQLISDLIAVIDQRSLTLVVTIHDNPSAGNGGSQKARGHLGSELMRKSESVLKITKEENLDQRTLTTDFIGGKNRNAPDVASHFKWSDSAEMFVSCEDKRVRGEKENKIAVIAKQIFSKRTMFNSYTELIEFIRTELGVGKSQAKNRIADFLGTGYVEKDQKRYIGRAEIEGVLD